MTPKDSQFVMTFSFGKKEEHVVALEAYCKACDNGKRSPELEDLIITDSWCSSRYAFCIIKGKLPEKMHNKMLLYAIKDPNASGVKQYFKFINDIKRPI